MDRRSFFKTVGLGISAAAINGCAGFESLSAKIEKKTNIVLIMTDDMGIEALGCYGGSSYNTANLDKLAKSGTRFTNCYSQPLCTPSRVKIMTGKSNVRNYKHFGILPKGEQTFAHILKDCGYKTCIVGKWQLHGSPTAITGDWVGKGADPIEAGFDEYCLWQVDGLGSRYANPLIKQNGEYLEGMEEKYGPDVFCDYALDFIDNNKSNPFLLYHSMTLPHSPFVPTPDSSDWNTDRDKNDKKYFKDMVEYIDKIVGKIAAKIDDAGLADNTVIIFTSDNGTHRDIRSKMGENIVGGGKGRMKDSGTHVPLIAMHKGKTPKGGVCDDLVDFSDFLPTLADIATCGKLKIEGLDGHTFMPQIYGKKGNPREWIFMYYDPMTSKNESKPVYFARDKRWKLYGTGDLYDLTTDPIEKTPIQQENETAEAAKIRKKLRSVITSFGL